MRDMILGYGILPFPKPISCPGGGSPPAVTGSCCIGTNCVILTSAQCAASGGTYRGDNTTCAIPCAGGGGE